MVSAQALGLAQACLETSIKYVKEEPLSALRWALFRSPDETYGNGHPHRSAARRVYKAAWLIDRKPDYTLAAMAKFYGRQTAVFCAITPWSCTAAMDT